MTISKSILRQTGFFIIAGITFWAAVIHAGLEYWLARDLRNPNWWWNDIGVPRCLGEIMLIIQEELTPPELDRGVEIIAPKIQDFQDAARFNPADSIPVVKGKGWLLIIKN